jgi:hypothetical protein
MTETQERFLRAVAARVPADRVAELHLFPSLRQGPIESGVAVIAVAREAPAAAVAGVATGAAAGDDTAGSEGAGAETDVVADGADGATALDEASADGDADAAAAACAVEPAVPPTANEARAASRLTIYTAHYRLTIKGPDRGKWELGVSAEADAPLVTLDAVVRGVRHRAGDAADTVRLSGDEFRAALTAPGAPAWAATT